MKEETDSAESKNGRSKDQFDKKQKQDFDDLMSGKMKKDSEKNLQDLFKSSTQRLNLLKPRVCQ